MTEPECTTLLRSQIFGEDQSLLYLCAPVAQGDSLTHDHDFLEIVLIVSGHGMHFSAHGVQPLSRGDFFVLRPGAWHSYRQCEDLHLFNCCCAPELLRRELALLGDDPAVTRLLWTEPREPGTFGILHRELTEQQTEKVETQLRALMEAADEPFTVRAGRLLVLLGQLGQDIYPAGSEDHFGIHTAVSQGVHLLEDGCNEEWNLARLAALTKLNPSYLTRLFKSATGRSPMQYLARHRAERAANLLLATDQPIGEIGQRVGWSDPNYFARRFKSAYGITPSAYRLQQVSEAVTHEYH